jgi:hypothetical protein
MPQGTGLRVSQGVSGRRRWGKQGEIGRERWESGSAHPAMNGGSTTSGRSEGAVDGEIRSNVSFADAEPLDALVGARRSAL